MIRGPRGHFVHFDREINFYVSIFLMKVNGDVRGGKRRIVNNLFDLLDLLKTNERTSGEGSCLEKSALRCNSRRKVARSDETSISRRDHPCGMIRNGRSYFHQNQ